MQSCMHVYILIHKVRKIFKNEKNVILHFWPKKFEGAFWNAQTNATIHRQFEDKFENEQWRKAKQMRPMWFFILWGRQFEATFKNAQWRKIKQMQPVWLCLLCPMFFEETYEEAQSENLKVAQTYLPTTNPLPWVVEVFTHLKSGSWLFYVVQLEPRWWPFWLHLLRDGSWYGMVSGQAAVW